MKKLLLVLAVGAFVACNNGSSTESTTDTSSTKTADTASMAPASTDTSHMPADTTGVKKDTTKK